MFSRAPRAEAQDASASAGPSTSASNEVVNGESLPALRQMVLGKTALTEAHKQPGKYLAMDCEMVGVGPEGTESSLARVSLVNFHGAVLLDVFVRQRERVTDYRTHVSGVRERDMIGARPFEEVQKQVAALLADKILVGHAVHNDLQALLLSHPRAQTRDTQFFAGKLRLVRSSRVALRALVQQELGMAIQAGEHSSVTDARATMAVFRIHRRAWEAWAAAQARKRAQSESKGNKRRHGSLAADADEVGVADADDVGVADDEEDGEGVGMEGGEDETPWRTPSKPKSTSSSRKSSTSSKKTKPHPKQGISSGLSTVVRHAGGAREVRRGAGASGSIGGKSAREGGAKPAKEKTQWWKELGSGTVKGSMRL
ncbi:ribonuclease H-like protein [Schizophyllum commune H4-8]|uniref:ribonuclease H-like protein n=1 Tax=Schizophyllum commune (strain H4-8 / FGSC 9210) TaxID=578458 RepID=UPI00215E57AB|nr:ribonuclease H-like protein [Schizophyllum commune H4-8]KAI5889847.1 ribonuclease H-like protein [Schizophyllum commune H4-8]